MTEYLATLAEVAAHQAGGAPDEADAAWRTIPVSERGLLAAIALAAADRPINNKQVSEIGRFSRTQFSPNTKPSRQRTAVELATAVDIARPLAEFLLGQARSGPRVAALAADVQSRDQTIAQLRQQLANAAAARQAVEAYAGDVHDRLYPEHLENARTREQRVVDVTPRLRLVRNETDPEESTDE